MIVKKTVILLLELLYKIFEVDCYLKKKVKKKTNPQNIKTIVV